MKRLIAILGVAVLALGLLAGTLLTSSSTGADKGPLDIVYDDARGLVPGQVVQVAGAKVGTIEKVSVTDDYKARVHLEIDKEFLPFSKDATCTIKPQGLIAENYVACDPGTPDAGELKPNGDNPPTVPVKQTSQPVSLTDLFEVWNTPTRDRARVLFSMLGMATAGRGQDLNDMLRRLNPTLALARKTIGILERQRDELAQTVDETGEITAALAKRPEELRDLIRHAGRVSVQTASQRGALAEGIRRLPPLLEEAQPALQRINRVIDSGQPLVDKLGDAAPDINRVAADVPRLSKAAAPALRKLGPVLRAGAKTARQTAPVARVMQQYARNSLPSARTAGEMFPALEKSGFTNNLLSFFYNAALASSRYDSQSHIIPAHVTLTQCSNYATTPVEGCGAAHTAAAARDAREKTAKKQAAPAPAQGIPPLVRGPAPLKVPQAPATPAPKTTGEKLTSGLGERLSDPISGLLDYLLR